MPSSAAGRARAAAIRAARALEPFAARIALALAGLTAGWYGLAAGIVIGAMVDIARLEARERRRIQLFLEDPGRAERGVPQLCLAAAAAIALAGDWPGTRDRETRIILLSRMFAEADADADAEGGGAAQGRAAERAIEAASRCGDPDLASLARYLARSGEGCAASAALARWAYALAALGGLRLGAGDELRIRASLADCGIGGEAQAAARARSFPDSPDPWTALGLSPGASAAEVKRAYRRLSRLFHPDLAPGAEGGSERFNELREAYAELSGRR